MSEMRGPFETFWILFADYLKAFIDQRSLSICISHGEYRPYTARLDRRNQAAHLAIGILATTSHGVIGDHSNRILEAEAKFFLKLRPGHQIQIIDRVEAR